MKNKTTHEELTKEIILEKLKNELKDERDQVTIENVYPSMLEEIFGWDTGTIQIIGGRDLDYEGSFDKYTFSGSAYYGYCSFYLNEEFIDGLSDEDETENEPKSDTEDSEEIKVSEVTEEENVFTRRTFMLDNRSVQAPPVIEISNEELNEAINKGILHKYYIAFYCHGETVKLFLFYAKQELDVRRRAFSIWGRKWDDIFDETKYLERIDDYSKYYHKVYPKPDDTFVLEWGE